MLRPLALYCALFCVRLIHSMAAARPAPAAGHLAAAPPSDSPQPAVAVGAEKDATVSTGSFVSAGLALLLVVIAVGILLRLMLDRRRDERRSALGSDVCSRSSNGSPDNDIPNIGTLNKDSPNKEGQEVLLTQLPE
jgi:hypothetical protein